MAVLGAGLCGLCTLVLLSASPVLAAGDVRVVSVPERGAAPDAEVDGSGVVHLVYVADDNVRYVRSQDGGKTFTSPLQVNSEPGTVHPPHMFRGPDLAIGRNGLVHVVWYGNGYQRSLPKDQWGVMYSRWAPAAKAFEPTRNLNHRPSDNYSLAADDRDHVAVVWMAGGLYVTASRDGGKTFAEAERMPGADTCECCASRSVLSGDVLRILYRDKAEDDRDMYIFNSPLGGRGGSFREKLSGQSWHINACPMTGAFLAEATDQTLVGAWERQGQIYVGRIGRDGRLLPPGEMATPRTDYLRKFPVALALPGGVNLVAWKHGKVLEWQRLDASGKPVGKVSVQDTESPHRPAGLVTRDGNVLLFP